MLYYPLAECVFSLDKLWPVSGLAMLPSSILQLMQRYSILWMTKWSLAENSKSATSCQSTSKTILNLILTQVTCILLKFGDLVAIVLVQEKTTVKRIWDALVYGECHCMPSLQKCLSFEGIRGLLKMCEPMPLPKSFRQKTLQTPSSSGWSMSQVKLVAIVVVLSDLDF